jgi:hypothetical protein
LRTLFTTLF